MALFTGKAFRKLFAKKDTSVLGVDIGSSAIKLVQLRRDKGVAILESYGEIALGPYANAHIGSAVQLSNERTAEALRDLVREADITAQATGFSIPFASSLISMISVPSTDAKQINKIVPIEARKYIPVPINEVMLDWFIIPESERETLDEKEEGESRNDKKKSHIASVPHRDVLLVAIHNNVLENYHTIIGQAQLKSDFFEIEIFGSLRSSYTEGLAPIMIIDVGAATTKAYIVEKGIVRSSHVINRGSQDITQELSKKHGLDLAAAEEMKRTHTFSKEHDEEGYSETALFIVDYIFSEANRVLLNYQRKYNKNVGTVILTGGGSVMKGMLEVAKEKLSSKVTLADPFSKVDAPSFLDDVLRDIGPAFSVAVGLALRKLQELE